MGAVLNGTASNPLTLPKLLETLGWQVGIVGIGIIICALILVPYLQRMEDMAMFYKRGIPRFWRLIVPFTFKGVCFIVLLGTLGILLTDVGWSKAAAEYLTTTSSTNCVNPLGLSPNPYPCSGIDGIWNFLFLARASGAPNGAHLLSYIPLPFLGLYVAFKYRKDILLDCFQGILVVGFGVAVHELIWLVGYWFTYARYWDLAVASNVVEDMGFSIMCSLLVYAFWKYPYRTIPFKVFKWPIVAYGVFIAVWTAFGMPITTINNWQLGSGIYMTTQWWGNLGVNAVEVFSWMFIAASFWVVIWRQKRPSG